MNEIIWQDCLGNYSCFAENELGKSRGFIELSGENHYDDCDDDDDDDYDDDDDDNYEDFTNENHDDFLWSKENMGTVRNGIDGNQCLFGRSTIINNIIIINIFIIIITFANVVLYPWVHSWCRANCHDFQFRPWNNILCFCHRLENLKTFTTDSKFLCYV